MGRDCVRVTGQLRYTDGRPTQHTHTLTNMSGGVPTKCVYQCTHEITCRHADDKTKGYLMKGGEQMDSLNRRTDAGARPEVNMPLRFSFLALPPRLDPYQGAG